MPTKFASGKFAIAECDRCGQRYMLKELRKQVLKTKMYNVKVCQSCWDPDQPQLSLGLYPVNDPQAVGNQDRIQAISCLVQTACKQMSVAELAQVGWGLQRVVAGSSNGVGIRLAWQEQMMLA